MRFVSLFLVAIVSFSAFAQQRTVSSPDGQLTVEIDVNDGRAEYAVKYGDDIMLQNSPLGLVTKDGDFSKNMKYVADSIAQVTSQYNLEKIKKSNVSYEANKLIYTVSNAEGKELSIVFQVSNNDVAFRYELPRWGETIVTVINNETTGFKLPKESKAFLSYMMRPMTGFARTAPSYESGYQADVPMDQTNAEEGYVFPGLFKIEEKGWVLISETGVSSQYCASHLSAYHDGMYTVEYPNPDQNNGFGSSGAQIGMPGATPWRTLTVGKTLKPITETTIPYDVVEPLYGASQKYEYGKGTWSWMIWDDNSMNYEDQVKFIDLAAVMDFEYILIDAWWDRNIGYERMEELIKYAKSKGVDVFLWYNSNGSANDAFQTPLNKMNTSINRKKEMKWLQEVGVKGLKVDFFGGDKQETIRLYEDILSDANEYGLMIIFHGATLPRGWAKMYPNFVGSEAVLASEMLKFSQDVREKEAFYASLHPFMRNSVACMEFGGVIFNKYINKGNKEGQKRLTTDAFQLATGVLFQNPVQMFALTPNKMEDTPQFELDFMTNLPTTWDATVFIDGYPGKYSVLARKSADKWYVAGVNAEETAKKLDLEVPMLAGQTVKIYSDDAQRKTYMDEVKVGRNGRISVTIQSKGGFVIVK